MSSPAPHQDSIFQPVFSRPWAVLVAAALVLLFLITQAVAFAVVDELGLTPELDRPLDAATALTLTGVQLAGIVVGLGMMMATFAVATAADITRPGRSAFVAWVALLPVGAIVLLPGITFALFSDGTAIAASVSFADVVAFGALAVFIGLNEELWFRGLLIDALGGRARPWLAVIGSAVLFGLPHYGPSTAAVLNMLGVTLAVGIPFAAVRLRFGAIAPLVIWHALINTWAFVHTARVVATGSRSTVQMTLSLLLPACLALGYGLWLRRSLVASSRVDT